MADDLTSHRTIPNDYNCYHPLRSERHEIRLLRILPGGDDDGLVVAMVRSNRSNHPEYRALSYCWGSLDELAPITVVFEDDHDVDSSSIVDADEPCSVVGARAVAFQITTSLHDALASFRRTRERGYLWVDMLCINQGDVDERSGQVRFMTSIYESAASVVVWLGADPKIRKSVFSPENYEIALTSLMLEEGGWDGEERPDEFLTTKEEWSLQGHNHALATLLAEARPVFDKSPVTNLVEEGWPGQNWLEDFPAKEGLRRFYCFLSNPRLHGRGEEDAHSAFKHAFQIYRSRIKAASSELWQWFKAILTLERLMPAAPPFSMFRRMSVIAKAPWFRRVWVIQEVASTNRVRVRVADHEGSWEILRSLTNFVGKLFVGLAVRQTAGLPSLGPQDQNLIPMLWKDLGRWRNSNMPTITRLLIALPSFSATDPRDLVISLSGIAADLQPGLFEPDYRMPVGETYARFASAVIRSTGRLDVLSKPKTDIRPNRPAGLPSWTLDFSNKSPRDQNPVYKRGERDEPFGRTLVRMKDTNSWSALHVAGIYETRVVEIISVQVVDDFLKRRDGKELDSKTLLDVPLPNLWACVNEVYAKTFLVRGGNHRSTRTSSLSLTQFCDTLVPWPGEYQQIRNEVARLLEQNGHGQTEFNPLANHIKLLLSLSLRDMCLFFTEDGNLGICSEGTQCGDLVAALYGLHHLVVLRSLERRARQGGGYQLVGKCRLVGAACEDIMRLSNDGDGGSANVTEEGLLGNRALKSEFFYLE